MRKRGGLAGHAARPRKGNSDMIFKKVKAKLSEKREARLRTEDARRRADAAVKRVLGNTAACSQRYEAARLCRNELSVSRKAIGSRMTEAGETADIYLRAIDRAFDKAKRIEIETLRQAGPYDDRYKNNSVPYDSIVRLAPAGRLALIEDCWTEAGGRTVDLLAEAERYADAIRMCLSYVEGRRDELPGDRVELARLKAEDAQERARAAAEESERKAGPGASKTDARAIAARSEAGMAKLMAIKAEMDADGGKDESRTCGTAAERKA